jgi:hypothetical protein
VPRELHLFGELAMGRSEQFLRHSAALQLLGMGRLERRTRGPAKRGSGNVEIAATAFQGPLRGVTPSSGRHCSTLRGRTIPRRCLLLCTQKPFTPPRLTAGFRIIQG